MSWISVTINLVVSTTVAKIKVDIPLSQLLSHHHICSVSYKFSTHHLIYIKTLMITQKKWQIKIIPHKEISQTQLWSEAYQNKDRDMSWNFWKFSLQIFKSPKVTWKHGSVASLTVNLAFVYQNLVRAFTLDPYDWPASNFSLQYQPWITIKGLKKKGNDHQLNKFLIVKQILIVSTTGNV